MNCAEKKAVAVEWLPGSASFPPILLVRERERRRPRLVFFGWREILKAIAPLPHRKGGAEPQHDSAQMEGPDARRLRELLFEAEGRGLPARPRPARRAEGFDPRPGVRPRHAFSLIELIGVLAVLAILAVVLIPVVIKRVDRAAWTKEVADLGAINNALTLQILRSNNIPNETTWAAAVANWVMRPATDVSINRRHYNRVYLIDPNFTLPGSGL